MLSRFNAPRALVHPVGVVNSLKHSFFSGCTACICCWWRRFWEPLGLARCIGAANRLVCCGNIARARALACPMLLLKLRVANAYGSASARTSVGPRNLSKRQWGDICCVNVLSHKMFMVLTSAQKVVANVDVDIRSSSAPYVVVAKSLVQMHVSSLSIMFVST